MKTRLQLLDGLVNGTLTGKERMIALENPVVFKAYEDKPCATEF